MKEYNEVVESTEKERKYIGFGFEDKHFKFLLGFIFIISASVIGSFIPFTISKIIDNSQAIFNFVNNQILVVCLFILQALLTTLGNFNFVDIAESESHQLRNKIINKILFAKAKDLDTLSIGKIPSHIDNNIKTIQEYKAKSLPSFINAIAILIVTLFFLFKLDTSLSLLLLVLLPILAIVIIPVTIFAGKYADAYQKENANYIEKLSNIFNNVLYLKSLNAQTEISNNLNDNNNRIKEFSTKNNKVNAFIQPFLLLVVIGIIAVIFMFGGNRVSDGSITIGTLIAYLLYVFQLLSPVTGISSFFADKQRAIANYAEINSYLKLELEESRENEQLSTIEEIEFKSVSFKYDQDDVIRNLNLSIKAGEKVAIVGESGAGKSTIFKLLLGLYNEYDGEILVNHQNIQNYSISSLRNHIALIPQENSIIFSNLEQFLKLGSKELDNNHTNNILAELNLAEKFNLNNNSLDQVDFGMGGKNLSTGEKQRILVAKAMIANKDVVLMDESTSAVDANLENQIFTMLDKYYDNKIVLSIAHRLSTVKYVDRVIFFENGIITGDDTHENLYNTHAKYKQYIDLANIDTL